MSKDPAFLFYPNDYIGGTMGMTFEEKGAYMELLMMQFNRGHMTSHMIGHIVGQLWDTIQHKFIQDNKGLWYNERLEAEKNKRKLYTESRINNKRGKNQYSKGKKQSGHMTSHMENENENENIDDNEDKNYIEFDIFWNLYDKKIGDKKRCIKKWNKLSEPVQLKIIESLPGWLKQFSEKQFQPYPETYLNQERWNDEVVINKPKSDHPDYYAQSYEKTLNSTQTIEYHKYLKSLGFVKVTAPGGTNWIKPKI